MRLAPSRALPASSFVLAVFSTVLASGLGGCTGTIASDSSKENEPPGMARRSGGTGGGGGGGGRGGMSGRAQPGPSDAPDGLPAGTSDCLSASVGRTPARLLTRHQIASVVADVFAPLALSDSVRTKLAGLPDDQEGAGFFSNARASLDSLWLSQLLSVADAVADEVASGFETLGLGCVGTRDCAGKLVSVCGRRAFRRSLANEEINEILRALYDPERSFDAGVKQLVRGLLLAPDTVYQYELGAPASGGRQQLTALDLASKLSFFFWDTIPDEALLSAAERGDLGSATAFDAHVQRLMSDPRALATFGRFAREWLLPDDETPAKDKVRYPGFTAQTFADALGETDRFMGNLIESGRGTFGDLLASPVAFLSPALAKIYGVTLPPNGETYQGWRKVGLDPGNRAGLLTRIAFLAASAHEDSSFPTMRGKLVRMQVMCQGVPDPPPDVQDLFPTLRIKPGQTTREAMEETTKAEARCAGCHSSIDPIGFAFEAYNAIGAFRTTDNGAPVNAASTIEPFGAVKDAVELSSKLAADPQASACYVDGWFRFALLREAGQADLCALDQLKKQFATGGNRLRDLIVAVTRSSAFHYRAAP